MVDTRDADEFAKRKGYPLHAVRLMYYVTTTSELSLDFRRDLISVLSFVGCSGNFRDTWEANFQHVYLNVLEQLPKQCRPWLDEIFEHYRAVEGKVGTDFRLCVQHVVSELVLDNCAREYGWHLDNDVVEVIKSRPRGRDDGPDIEPGG